MTTWRKGLGSTNYNSQILSAIPSYCPSCPSSLVLSLVQTESSGNPSAVSPAGAIGLFQLMPATAAGLNVNPNDPSQNIQGGLTYLQQLYNQFGNWTDALEAYNEGPGALQGQLNAGVTPTSAGYASGILSAAGISDSSDTSDLGVNTPASDSLDLSDLTDLSGTSGPSWVLPALIAAGIIGVAVAIA